MRTVQATDRLVSIWIDREEAPTREQMLCLVRQALADRGLTPWPQTEAECFAVGEETLLIARPGPGRRLAFYFGDLEALLEAARALPDGESSLYTYGDGYVLALPAEAGRTALWEYGRALEPGGEWELHVREQGGCLLDGDALDRLRRAFHLESGM